MIIAELGVGKEKEPSANPHSNLVTQVNCANRAIVIQLGAEFLFIPPFDYVSLGIACPAEEALPGLDGTERESP